jgi:hypothetical protein
LHRIAIGSNHSIVLTGRQARLLVALVGGKHGVGSTKSRGGLDPGPCKTPKSLGMTSMVTSSSHWRLFSAGTSGSFNKHHIPENSPEESRASSGVGQIARSRAPADTRTTRHNNGLTAPGPWQDSAVEILAQMPSRLVFCSTSMEVLRLGLPTRSIPSPVSPLGHQTLHRPERRSTLPGTARRRMHESRR